MEVFFAQTINALILGGIYALLVTGFTLLLVVGGVFHYAYATVVVMGMYIFWMALGATGDNLTLSISITIGAGVGMSLLTEPIFRPLAKKGAAITSFIVSLAMGMVLLDMMSRQLNRGFPISFPRASLGGNQILISGIVALNTGQLAVILGSFGAVAAFLYLLYRTKQGRAFRAMAQNPFSARLLGIPIARMSINSYAFAGLLGGISSIFLSMALRAASGIVADSIGLKVLAIALFAGLGNLRGGLIAAFILAFAETMTLGYMPGDWANAIAFGMIVIVVMVKPQGLFGTRA